MKKHIPNGITLGNLLCGCIGITLSFQGDAFWPVYLIYLAALLDFLDGFAARLLKVSSPIGKELDSLADLVTFGLLPSIMVFNYLSKASAHPYLPYIAFLIALCSALRLAKFNVDTRQSEAFIGLPTPANALFFSSLPFVLASPFASWVSQESVIVLVVLFSALMVSELKLFALKFKDFRWKGNEIRFLFILIAVVLVVTLRWLGIPPVILLYLLMSLVPKKQA